MAGLETVNHVAVLASAATERLLDGGGCYIDATFGDGGHSRCLLGTMPASSRLIALDCDEYAAQRAEEVKDERFCFFHRSYAEMEDAVATAGAENIRGVLFDLGVSSMQLDNPERGMSFKRLGPLDMRFDRRTACTAKKLLASCGERELIRILKEYGEEPEASRVGRAIYERRRRIPDTMALAKIVADSKRSHPPGRHPATLTFQALRIAVNREWETLRRGLSAASRLLSDGGRLAVIAFHSLEERIVRRALSAPAFPGIGRLETPRMRQQGKMITPTAEEIAANPRARSARMRIFVKEPA